MDSFQTITRGSYESCVFLPSLKTIASQFFFNHTPKYKPVETGWFSLYHLFEIRMYFENKIESVGRA